MKKFKHKKTGEIATYENGVLKSSGFCVELGVEPSKEFWEEVQESIEKDYEILSFISNKKHGVQGHIVHIKNGKSIIGHYAAQGYIDNFNGWWDIHSVQRLSDGEVFTLGDTVDHLGREFCDYTNIKITRLTLSDDKIKVWGYYNDIMEGCGNLEYVSKSKPPLFRTEDGVDIFENTECYGVNKIAFIIAGKHRWQEREWYCPRTVENLIFFSTQEAAEEYIIMNKPCLSVKEVLGIAKLHDYTFDTPYITTSIASLKELAKQRI